MLMDVSINFVKKVDKSTIICYNYKSKKVDK